MGRHGGSLCHRRFGPSHLAFWATSFFFLGLRGQTISIERRRSPSGQMNWSLGWRSERPVDCLGIPNVIRFFSVSHLVTRACCSVVEKICLKLSPLDHVSIGVGQALLVAIQLVVLALAVTLIGRRRDSGQLVKLVPQCCDAKAQRNTVVR
jgi:hypothetical protein